MNKDIVLNKRLYKINLFLLKLLPVIMCSGLIIASYGATFQISEGFVIVLQIVSHYIGLVMAPIGFMYISSYIFKFCNYHRMFIHYIAIIEFMNVTNWYFKIPISNELYNRIQITITITFFIVIVIMYIKKRRDLRICKKEARTD